MTLFTPFPPGKFDVILLDPPWKYYGSADKDQAAGKHYECLEQAELEALPVATALAKPGVVFCWTTSAMLPQALYLVSRWGLFYRGIAFVWVKSNKSGAPIMGQGVRPSITKPTTELVIAASTMSKGRPLPISDESVGQVIVAPRPAANGLSVHSAKPAEAYERIEKLYPTASKLELFARQSRPGWACWGNEVSAEKEVER